MRVTYTAWDDDHRHPVDVRMIEDHLHEVSGGLSLLGVALHDGSVRLSFSIVGESWDVDFGRDEWPAIRDRIDSLFDQETP